MEIIVGKSAGFCYGVKRAVENCEKEIKIANGKKVYCLGELVHNKQVIQKLENEGVLFIEDINSIEQPHVKLIIRAHGVPKSTYDIAKQKEIILKPIYSFTTHYQICEIVLSIKSPVVIILEFIS